MGPLRPLPPGRARPRPGAGAGSPRRPASRRPSPATSPRSPTSPPAEAARRNRSPCRPVAPSRPDQGHHPDPAQQRRSPEPAAHPPQHAANRHGQGRGVRTTVEHGAGHGHGMSISSGSGPGSSFIGERHRADPFRRVVQPTRLWAHPRIPGHHDAREPSPTRREVAPAKPLSRRVDRDDRFSRDSSQIRIHRNNLP